MNAASIATFIVWAAVGAGIGHALVSAAEITAARWKENHRA
jgi:hypothetical protein